MTHQDIDKRIFSDLRKNGLLSSNRVPVPTGVQQDPIGRAGAFGLTRWCLPFVSTLFGMALFTLAPAAQAQTETVNVPSQPLFTTPYWFTSGVVPAFDIPFADVTATTVSIQLASIVSQTYYNPGIANALATVSGSSSFDVALNGRFLHSYSLSPYGSTIIAPHAYGYVQGIANPPAYTLSLGVTASPGTISLTSYAGTGPNLQTLGSVQVIYSYTLRGLTQQNPILPSVVLDNKFTFSGVPSNRWFDPPITSAYLYQVTSAGDSVAAIKAFPSGFTGAFEVTANGIDYGAFHAGDALFFPAGTTSFVVSGISPGAVVGDGAGFPLALAFNRDGVNFTMTAIPEPSAACLVLVAGALLLSRLWWSCPRRLLGSKV